MRVLFIGGTGVISTACSKLCVDRGIDLWLLNRGNHMNRIPKGIVGFIPLNINDIEKVRGALGWSEWDCIIDWTVMTQEHAERDISLFAGRTKQFIYVTSTAVYKAPLLGDAIVETSPLVENPIWGYTRGKLEAEMALLKSNLPLTIVRPGHTYCEFTIPTNIIGLGYGLVKRMKEGKKIIIHDDGLNSWTLTHSSDVAVGLVGLIGREDAIGEIFHITHSKAITWLNILRTYANFLNIEPRFEFIPSSRIYQIDHEIGASLLGHRALSKLFDNSKIKKFVPDYKSRISFAQGIRGSLLWHEENRNKIYYNRESDKAVDRIVEANDYFKNTL